jgi:anti-anti-sigma factor
MYDHLSISKQGEVFIIKLITSRALTQDTHDFTNLLMNIINTPYLKLIIDLSECEFIDSTFIGAMVMANKIVSANEGQIKLIIVKENVLKIFEDMRLDKIFLILNNLEEQLNNF